LQEKGETKEATIEEFHRIDVRVAKVAQSEKVPGSKRLLKLIVDLGDSKRQCVTGIGEQYTADDLRGKLIAVVTNLKPRKIMGLDSEVMILAALDGPTISVLRPDKEVSAGAKIT
jgi:methionine--tRNA ligase beta chain